MLTNGIKMGEYYAAVLLINADTAGARINFEKVQLRLLEFKSLIDESKRNQRNVSSVEGRGRGGGGCGRGRGGPGKGRGCGNGLAPRRAETTNRSNHVTTVGGQALRISKLPNGDWDTVQISRGTHDHLSKKQVHINKTWYPSLSMAKFSLWKGVCFLSTNMPKRVKGKEGAVLFSPLLLSLFLKIRCPQSLPLSVA